MKTFIVIMIVFAVVLGLAIHSKQSEPVCLRSHVEVNNVPEHTVFQCTQHQTGFAMCEVYEMKTIPATRVETPVCDEYEVSK